MEGMRLQLHPGLAPRISRRRVAPRRAFGLLAAVMVAALAPAAQAKPPLLDIVPQKELRFGSFGVISSGARVVSPAGAVTNVSIMPVPGSFTGPAEFTIVYDRGNENKRAISLVIEVILLSAPPLNQSGLSATVSDFTTDLPGAANLAPGQAVTFSIDNCITRQCARSFKVGGRLQVQRAYGGGAISIPLPISANVVTIDGRRP